MEGHHHESAAFRQGAFRRSQARLQLRQFLVHRDAQRLEGAGGGMHRRAATPAQRPLHYVRQVERAG